MSELFRSASKAGVPAFLQTSSVCLAKGTLINTKNGLVPIENVNPGDMVVTEAGLKKVSASHANGLKSTIRVVFRSGQSIVLTKDHLVYAGDSGNDRAAMLAGYRVIVVGNADAALKAELATESAVRGISERIYFAQKPYAAGVLEGLRHFAFVP